MLSFETYKSSFLKDIYHLENDIFCIFDTSGYSAEIITALCEKARQYVTHGFIFQTSGTTANRKFVLHDFDGVKASAVNINEFTKVDSKDVFLAPISIHHMGGFSVLSRSVFANAKPALILKDWSLPDFLTILKEKSVSVTSLVPSLVYELVQKQAVPPKSLKTVFVGGSGLSADLFTKALILGWPLIKTFGSSEACSQIFTQKNVNEHELVSLPHWKIRLDEDKRLQIKGPSLYQGYLIIKDGKIKFAATPRDDGGYFTTEDMVQLHERTLISFLGRINDFVKINSTLVNMEALRQKFYKFCVSQGLDPLLILIAPKEDLKSGLQIVAYSESTSKDLAEILKIWNAESPSPEKIRGLYFIQSLPKTDSGKTKFSLLP